MMPSICHQGAGINLLCRIARVPEHALLHDDGKYCCPQSELTGDNQISGIGVENLFVAAITDAQRN